MVLVDAAYEQVLVELGAIRHSELDEVVPCLQPQLPSNYYRAEYAWQHSYERALMRRAQRFIGAQRQELIGHSGLLSEALSNAYVHGNQRDPERPIYVALQVGANGYLLRISQSGQGFDFGKVLAQYRRRERYFSIAGNGLRKLDCSRNFRAFFGDGGRALHLWHADGRISDDLDAPQS